MPDKKRVVVVGGGVAGIEVASGLGTVLGRTGRADVTLVDRSWSHVWKPMLHGFAAGTARSDRDRVSFVAQGARRGFRFAPGAVAHVDRASRVLGIEAVAGPDGAELLPARRLPYDALVVALGSRANDFGTPGVAEHCLFLDTLDEADRFNARFREATLRAIAAGGTLAIAIVGGGATGVELAAELHRARDIALGLEDQTSRMTLAVTLLEAGPRLLPAFPNSVSRDAEAQLRALGIDVRTSAKVVGADAHGFTVEGIGRIEAPIRVWVAGVKASAGAEMFGDLARSKTGQLLVHPTLQSTEDDRIWAIGDCCRVEASPVPATAQAATQQASHLVHELPRVLEGGPATPFRYRDRGAIVSLGDYNGWGTLGKYVTFGGGPLRGLSARLAHDLLYRQHQVKLFGLARGAAAWGADALDRAVKPGVRLD